MLINEIQVGISLVPRDQVKKRNSIAVFVIELFQDFCGKQAACPAGVYLRDNDTAIVADKKIDAAVATDVRAVSMVPRLFTDF